MLVQPANEKKLLCAGEAAACINTLTYVLQERIIGQSEAVRALARAMWRARTGLKDPRRPIAAMLFAGGTGVGKTETTKVMSASQPRQQALCYLDECPAAQSLPQRTCIGSVDPVINRLCSHHSRCCQDLVL